MERQDELRPVLSESKERRSESNALTLKHTILPLQVNAGSDGRYWTPKTVTVSLIVTGQQEKMVAIKNSSLHQTVLFALDKRYTTRWTVFKVLRSVFSDGRTHLIQTTLPHTRNRFGQINSTPPATLGDPVSTKLHQKPLPEALRNHSRLSREKEGRVCWLKSPSRDADRVNKQTTAPHINVGWRWRKVVDVIKERVPTCDCVKDRSAALTCLTASSLRSA